MISIAKKAKATDEDDHEFGDVVRYAEYGFKNLSLERRDAKSLDFIEGFIYNERYRETSIVIMQQQPRLDSHRDIRVQEKSMFLEDNIRSGIYTVEPYQASPTSRGIVKQKEVIPELIANPGFNIIDQPDFTNVPTPNINKPYTDLFTYIHTDEGVIRSETILISKPEKVIQGSRKIIFGAAETKGFDIDMQVSAAVAVAQVFLDESQDNLGKESPNINSKDESVILSTEAKSMQADDQLGNIGSETSSVRMGDSDMLGSTDKLLKMSQEENDFAVQETKALTIEEEINVSQPDKGGFGEEALHVGQNKKEAFGFGQSFVSTYDISLLFDDGTNWFGQKDHILAIGEHQDFTSQHSKELNNIDEVYNLGTRDMELNMDNTKTISKRSTGTYTSEDAFFMHKGTESLYDAYANDFLLSKNSSTITSTEGITGNKTDKAISEDNNLFAKIKSSLLEINKEFMAHKTTLRELYIGDFNFVYKDNVEMYQHEEILAHKDNVEAYQHEEIFAYKLCKNPIRHESIASAYKASNGIVTDEITQVARNSMKNLEFSRYLCQVSKSYLDASITDTFFGFKKKPSNAWVDGEYYLADKAAKDLDTKMPNVLIDKLYKSALEQGNIVGVDKNPKTAMFDNICSMDKLYKPTNINNPIGNISKVPYNTSTTSSFKWIVVPMRTIGYNNTYFDVSKVYHDTGFTDTTVNYVKQYGDARFDVTINIDTIYRDTDINRNLFLKRPTLHNGAVNNGDFVDRENGVKIGEHLSVHDDRKFGIEIDTNLHIYSSRPVVVDDPNNFAYTDKVDYVSIKDDRSDELELPPTDFNYSEFARKLFVNGSIDGRYVKRIDAETGNPIVSLPIENPVKHFADLAIHYIDLNVGMLTYIIEKVYNIWQNNIFVYSAMSSDGALNDMLRKLKQNLFIQYPSEKDQEHLHRAIRLFRWYCEMSILNNSDYMVKLTYKDLEVDYANRDLSAILNLGTVDNFEIDSSFVLSQIDNTRSSFINMSFNRNHKTRLCFDLATTGGICTITVNGVSTTYIDEFVKIDIVLIEGDTKIEIMFNPTDSSAYNGIMKFAIARYDIKSYEVEYIGKIGEFNPTANHLVTMLSVCGDSIEDMQKTLAHNAPTVAALDQLREYFDLHHQDKLKGKRLITKH